MITHPQISIIVLTLNEEKNIARCLENIFNQKTKYSFEVIVIDSSSSDGTVDIVNQFPVKLKKILRSEFHHGGTRNLGAELSKGEYLVYLAGDAFPNSDHWLDSLINPFQNNELLCAVYGKQIPKLDCNPINKFRLSWNYPDKKIFKNQESISSLGHRNYFFSTVNCSIRRQSWNSIKFRGDIPIFEDTAFAKELINSGFTIFYEPSACVIHSHNLCIIDLIKRYKEVGFVQTKFSFIENLGKSYRSEGFDYLFSGIRVIAKKNSAYWVIIFIFQTFFGFIGLNYGRYLANSGKEL